MIDRYTNAPPSNRLSTQSLPVAPDSQVPPSPTASMKTNGSANNPFEADAAAARPGSSSQLNANSSTPHTYQPNAQAARQPSQLEQTDGAGSGPVSRQREPTRQGSLVFSGPATADGHPQFPPQPAALSHEPKMFPGIVAARRRRSSVTRLSGTNLAGSAVPATADGEAGGMDGSTGSLRRSDDGITMGSGLEKRETTQPVIEEGSTEESE